MFEGLIHSLLKDLLSQFVKPHTFSPSAVEASPLGSLRLSNLELKSDAFDFLQLPLALTSGFVGSVELSVPWSTALSDQARATLVVDNCVLIFVTKASWTAEELAHREHLAKMARLHQEEVLKRARKAMRGVADSPGLSARLLGRMLSNLEITVRQVQVRVDMAASADCLGLSLGSLKVDTVDQGGPGSQGGLGSQSEPSEFSDTVKTCTLGDLQVYANPVSVPSRKQLVAVEAASLVLTTKDAGDADLSFSSPRVVFSVEPAQVRSLASLAALLQGTVVHPNRPTCSPRADPRAWWRFVLGVVTKRVRDRRYRLSPTNLARRRRDRIEYAALWEKHAAGRVSAQEANRLEWLERQHSLEELLLFRWAAENDALSRELQSRRDPDDQPAKGWLAWAFSAAEPDRLTAAELERALVMLREQAARVSVHATRTASLRLREGAVVWADGGSSLGEAAFRQLAVDVRTCGGDVTVGLSCDAVSLDDPSQPTGFARVVAPRASALPPLLSATFQARAGATPALTVRLAPIELVHSPDFLARLSAVLAAAWTLPASPRLATFASSSSPSASLSPRPARGNATSPQPPPHARRPAVVLDVEALSPAFILPSVGKTHVLVVDFGRLSLKDAAGDDAAREYQVAASPVHVFTMDATACAEWRDPARQRELGVFVVQHLVMVASVSQASAPRWRVRAVLPSTVRLRVSALALQHLQRVLGGAEPAAPAVAAQPPQPPASPLPSLDEGLQLLADAAARFMQQQQQQHDNGGSPVALDSRRRSSPRIGDIDGGDDGEVLVTVDVDLQLLRVEVDCGTTVAPSSRAPSRPPSGTPERTATPERAATPVSEHASSSEGFRTPPPALRQRSSSSQHTASVARALLDALEEGWDELDDDDASGADAALVVTLGGIFATASMQSRGRASGELSVDGAEVFLGGIVGRGGEHNGVLCRAVALVRPHETRVSVDVDALGFSLDAAVVRALASLARELLPVRPPAVAATTTAAVRSGGPAKLFVSLTWTRLSVELRAAALVTVLDAGASARLEWGALVAAEASVGKLNVADDEGVLLLGQGSVDAPLLAAALSRPSGLDVDFLLDSVIEEAPPPAFPAFQAAEVISVAVSRPEFHFRAPSLARIARWLERARLAPEHRTAAANANDEEPPVPPPLVTASAVKRVVRVTVTQPLVDALEGGGGKMRLLAVDGAVTVTAVASEGLERAELAAAGLWLLDDAVHVAGVGAVLARAEAVALTVSAEHVAVKLAAAKAARLWRLVADAKHALPQQAGATAAEPAQRTSSLTVAMRRISVAVEEDAPAAAPSQQRAAAFTELREPPPCEPAEPARPRRALACVLTGVAWESTPQRSGFAVAALEAVDSRGALVLSRHGEGAFATTGGDGAIVVDCLRAVVNRDVVRALAVIAACLEPRPAAAPQEPTAATGGGDQLAWRLRDAVALVVDDAGEGFGVSCAAASSSVSGDAALRGLCVVRLVNGAARDGCRALVAGLELETRDGVLALDGLRLSASLADAALAHALLAPLAAAAEPLASRGASGPPLHVRVRALELRLDDAAGARLAVARASVDGTLGGVSLLDVAALELRVCAAGRWELVAEPCTLALESDPSAWLARTCAPLRVNLSEAAAARVAEAATTCARDALALEGRMNEDDVVNATGMALALRLPGGETALLESGRSLWAPQLRALDFDLVADGGRAWGAAVIAFAADEQATLRCTLQARDGTGSPLHVAVTVTWLPFGSRRLRVESAMVFENAGLLALELRLGEWACALPAGARACVPCDQVARCWVEPALRIAAAASASLAPATAGFALARRGNGAARVELNGGASVTVRTAEAGGGCALTTVDAPVRVRNVLPTPMRACAAGADTRWVAPGEVFRSHRAGGAVAVLLPPHGWSAPLRRGYACVRFADGFCLEARWPVAASQAEGEVACEVGAPWWVRDGTLGGVLARGVGALHGDDAALPADARSVAFATLTSPAVFSRALRLPRDGDAAACVLECRPPGSALPRALCVSTERAVGGQRVLVVRDAVVIANATALPLLLRQAGSSAAARVEAGGCAAWDWATDAPRLLRVCVAEAGWLFSQGAALPAEGGAAHVMARCESGRVDVLEARTSAVGGGAVLVTVSRAAAAPCRVENASAFALRVWQQGAGAPATALLPGHALDFAWDAPALPPRLEVLAPDLAATADVFDLGEGAPQLLRLQRLRASRRIDGASVVLRFDDDGDAPRAFPQVSPPVDAEQRARRCVALHAESLVCAVALDAGGEALLLRARGVQASWTHERACSGNGGGEAWWALRVASLQLDDQRPAARRRVLVRADTASATVPALAVDIAAPASRGAVLVHRAAVTAGVWRVHVDAGALAGMRAAWAALLPRGGESSAAQTHYAALSASAASVRVSVDAPPLLLLARSLQLDGLEAALPPLQAEFAREGALERHVRAHWPRLALQLALSLRVAGVDALVLVAAALGGRRAAFPALAAALLLARCAARTMSHGADWRAWARLPLLALCDAALGLAAALDWAPFAPGSPRAPRGVAEGALQTVGMTLPALLRAGEADSLAGAREAVAAPPRRLASGLAWTLRKVFGAVRRSVVEGEPEAPAVARRTETATVPFDPRRAEGEEALRRVGWAARQWREHAGLEGGGAAVVTADGVLVVAESPDAPATTAVVDLRAVVAADRVGVAQVRLWRAQTVGAGLYLACGLGVVALTLRARSEEDADRLAECILSIVMND